MMKNNDHFGLSQERVAKDFDSVATHYQRDINKKLAFTRIEHSFFVDVKREHILRLAAKHFPDLTELYVLDLGCGVGVYHPGLEGSFRQLCGIDVSEQSVHVASKQHPLVQYATYDGIRLPYRDCQFSMVFVVCVMHHVPQEHWDKVMKELYRVTKPNGVIIIFEHNPYNPVTQYIVKSCDIDKDAVLLKPKKLKGLAERAGFEEICIQTIISVPPINPIFRKIDIYLGHFPFGAQYYLSGVKHPT